MKYTNLFLDVDGTIVGTENSPIGHDSSLASTLNEYMDNGGTISLVTGRSKVYSDAVYEIFGLNGTRIVEMGAGIVMPDNTIITLSELEQKKR